ncbi:UNVERIFIED_CONTAM: Alpha-mannosidase [Sesamum radiatum]|uniref:Alpha-mannosidase n=1 Tax=Sesamum radiatum TaxID=300843 RepID=A0AAW2RFW3_SESRA
MGRRSTSNANTDGLGNALGIAQHHDAVTGTAKQHTTNDYAKRLAIGATEAESAVDSALSCLVDSKLNGQCTGSTVIFSQVVCAYNSLGWNRTDIIRIPLDNLRLIRMLCYTKQVNDYDLVVKDSAGEVVESQYVEVDSVTRKLRKFYVEAYTGTSDKHATKYWLVFSASVPPLGWNTYFISKESQKGTGPKELLSTATSPAGNRRHVSMKDLPKKETIEIGPGNLKLSFSSSSGQLKRIFNSKTGIDIPVQQSYLWYASSQGDADPQASGAYIFRPNGSPPSVVSRSVPLKIIRGPLVDEVHQQFSSWIYQITRVYRDKDHAEVEFTVGISCVLPIGPIPTDDSIGKEVITRLSANMVTDKVFYTDSNARDFLKRVRDYRADWPLTVTQPVAGNYYPINLGIYIEDNKSELSVLVDRATGGSSIHDGEIELMLHRRMIYDDSRGVGEALDEFVCVNNTCEGLTVRGNYYISINELGAGARWRRTTGQEIYSPLLLAFTHEVMARYHSCLSYHMHDFFALISFDNVIQELVDGSVLFRLAHLYEAGEDPDYSKLAKVELKKMFAGKTVRIFDECYLCQVEELPHNKDESRGSSLELIPPLSASPSLPSSSTFLHVNFSRRHFFAS